MRVYLGPGTGVRPCGLGDREIMPCCMSLLIVEKRTGIHDYIVLNKRKTYYIKMKLKMSKQYETSSLILFSCLLFQNSSS